MRMKPQFAINYFVLQNKSQTGISAHPGKRVFIPVLLITDRNVRAPVKFISVCIFYAFSFLGLKKGLYYKKCTFLTVEIAFEDSLHDNFNFKKTTATS